MVMRPISYARHLSLPNLSDPGVSVMESMRTGWLVRGIIAKGGMRPDDEGKGRIGESGVVLDIGHSASPGETVSAVRGFPNLARVLAFASFQGSSEECRFKVHPMNVGQQ